jgi:hypothetical protein
VFGPSSSNFGESRTCSGRAGRALRGLAFVVFWQSFSLTPAGISLRNAACPRTCHESSTLFRQLEEVRRTLRELVKEVAELRQAVAQMVAAKFTRRARRKAPGRQEQRERDRTDLNGAGRLKPNRSRGPIPSKGALLRRTAFVIVSVPSARHVGGMFLPITTCP